jgi:hypothetical protein
MFRSRFTAPLNQIATHAFESRCVHKAENCSKQTVKVRTCKEVSILRYIGNCVWISHQTFRNQGINNNWNPHHWNDPQLSAPSICLKSVLLLSKGWYLMLEAWLNINPSLSRCVGKFGATSPCAPPTNLYHETSCCNNYFI